MSRIPHMVRKTNIEVALRKMQPADYIETWAPMLRAIEPEAELDFSFSHDAIVIIDKRVPSAQRVGVLYARHELEDNLHHAAGDIEKRMNEFLRKS